MDDLTFALDLAINAEQPRTHDDAAVFLEHSRPDDQIGDACLVLDGDEHDAFRRSRPLTDEDEPGEPDIAAIANSIERVAGNHLAGGKLAPPKRNRMLPQGPADKIGRATCRERGCQKVENTGGA